MKLLLTIFSLIFTVCLAKKSCTRKFTPIEIDEFIETKDLPIEKELPIMMKSEENCKKSKKNLAKLTQECGDNSDELKSFMATEEKWCNLKGK